MGQSDAFMVAKGVGKVRSEVSTATSAGAPVATQLELVDTSLQP
jgi:hypothetical protein